MHILLIYPVLFLIIAHICYAPEISLDLAHAAAQASEQKENKPDRPIREEHQEKYLEQEINDDESQSYRLDQYYESSAIPFKDDYGSDIQEWLEQEEEAAGIGEPHKEDLENERYPGYGIEKN